MTTLFDADEPPAPAPEPVPVPLVEELVYFGYDRDKVAKWSRARWTPSWRSGGRPQPAT